MTDPLMQESLPVSMTESESYEICPGLSVQDSAFLDWHLGLAPQLECTGA